MAIETLNAPGSRNQPPPNDDSTGFGDSWWSVLTKLNAMLVEIYAAIVTDLTATAAEVNRVADVSTRVVSLTTASPTLAVADHEGKTLVLNKADGVAVTLPAATGSGAIFRFVVGTAFSGGSFVATCTGNDTLKGLALGLDGDGVPANAWAAGASDEIFTMDGSTQGGAVGDEVTFEDIKADVWKVRAFLQQSGTEASPFSSAA